MFEFYKNEMHFSSIWQREKSRLYTVNYSKKPGFFKEQNAGFSGDLGDKKRKYTGYFENIQRFPNAAEFS